MHKQELLALCALLIILIGFPMSVFAYQYVYLPSTHGEAKVIDLVARAPEAGGWDPEYITVNKGDTVRLRITGHDVVHGFAIGNLGIDVEPIIPGEVTTVEFVADKVGRFTYYCNVWCDPYHYRMRGTLEVVDPAASDAIVRSPSAGLRIDHALSEANVSATEQSQGTDFSELDIDSPHEAEFYPINPPSAVRGRALADQIELPALGDGSTPRLSVSTELAKILRSQSPSAVFKAIRQGDSAASLRLPLRLRSEQGSGQALSDEEVWDLVAYLWSSATTPERQATGAALYAKNCAACHGETGGGDGPGGRYMEEQPTDFTNSRTMAGGSSEIYYAKIRRGGMGTGMPYWGTIFTEEETWSIVDYLWTFLFEKAKTE